MNKNIEPLLEEQLAYQKRIAKDIHSLYLLVIAAIVISVISIVMQMSV